MLREISANGGGTARSLTSVWKYLAMQRSEVAATASSHVSGPVHIPSSRTAWGWTVARIPPDEAIPCEEWCTGQWPACSVEAKQYAAVAITASDYIRPSDEADVAIANELAKSAFVVTKYSSMIVLVSNLQHAELSELERQEAEAAALAATMRGGEQPEDGDAAAAASSVPVGGSEQPPPPPNVWVGAASSIQVPIMSIMFLVLCIVVAMF